MKVKRATRRKIMLSQTDVKVGGLDGGVRQRAPYGPKKKYENRRQGEIRSKGMIVEMKVARPTRPILLKQ